MCDQAQLSIITAAVVAEAQRVFGAKLDKVILYGSYARGDFEADSDIDIMVLADIPVDSLTAYRTQLREFANRLDWEHDVLLSLTLRDCQTFYKWVDDLPFYRNVRDEGVLLSA